MCARESGDDILPAVHHPLREFDDAIRDPQPVCQGHSSARYAHGVTAVLSGVGRGPVHEAEVDAQWQQLGRKVQKGQQGYMIFAPVNSRLNSLGTLYTNAKIGLDAILDILTDLGDLYAKAEPAERRMLNRALFTKITIDDAEHVTTEPVQTIATILSTDTSPNNVRTLPHDEARQGSNVTGYVVSEVPDLNHMRRLERLDSAWKQGSPTLQASPPLVFDEGFDVVENPSRRSRTALTEKEVEAVRTVRDGGESVVSIAKRFGIHRATVWEHTKSLPAK